MVTVDVVFMMPSVCAVAVPETSTKVRLLKIEIINGVIVRQTGF